MMEANLIQGAYSAGIQDLMFLGSSCIYPRDCPQPIKEEYLLTGTLSREQRSYRIALALTDPKDGLRVVGLLTDRDLVVNVLAQGRTPDEQAVGAYSSVHLVRVPGSATVHEAIQAMHHHGGGVRP